MRCFTLFLAICLAGCGEGKKSEKTSAEKTGTTGADTSGGSDTDKSKVGTVAALTNAVVGFQGAQLQAATEDDLATVCPAAEAGALVLIGSVEQPKFSVCLGDRGAGKEEPWVTFYTGILGLRPFNYYAGALLFDSLDDAGATRRDYIVVAAVTDTDAAGKAYLQGDCYSGSGDFETFTGVYAGADGTFARRSLCMIGSIVPKVAGAFDLVTITFKDGSVYDLPLTKVASKK